MNQFLQTLFITSAFVLSACQSTTDYVEKKPERIGVPAVLGIIGAVSGYTVGGSGTAAITGGTALGVAGLGVGILASRYLATQDSRVVDPIFEKVLDGPTDKPMHWKNSHTGNSGTLTALSSPVVLFDKTCRWLRSEQISTASHIPVLGIHIDYGAMSNREDLVLCDNGEGWYITWDDRMAKRFLNTVNKSATTSASPVRTARHFNENEEVED